MRFRKWAILVITGILLQSCTTVAEHQKSVQDNSNDRVTVGSVQREIKIGMSGADVATALGSPNIVTTDEERREVWIYDKFSSDVSVSESDGYGTLIILGSTAKTGARSTSQRTLTVIIKFDKDKKVRDYSYRTSRF
jgi:outer membrane protein assembly factor BamE (lipoprotein component of BamABCDE complex)